MSVFLDILRLLTGSPGGLVYYLVVLFSVWAIVGLALSRWSRGERRGIVPRILIAGAVMSSLRFLPILLALFDRQGGSFLTSVAPPLERFVDSVSALLVCWAYVFSYKQRTLGRVFLGTTSLFSLGFLVFAVMQWSIALQANPSAAYNLSWQRWAWELWQLLFLVPTVIYLLVSSVQERGMSAVSLGILVAGHWLQATLPYAEQIPFFAGWVRFANLLAFPLLAVVTYRLMIQRFDQQATDLEAVNQESLGQLTSLMALLDTTRRMSTSLDLESVLDSAVRGVSQALPSDLCALVLAPYGPDGKISASDNVELSVVYNAPQVHPAHTTFQAPDYPSIQYALSRGKPVVLGPEQDKGVNGTTGSGAVDEPALAGKSAGNGQIARVYRLLGSEQTGPIVIQPLEHESSVTGAIVACRPGQQAPFTAIEAHKCETLATHLAAVVENARQHHRTQDLVEQLTNNLELLKTEYSRTKAHLQNRLKQSKEEVTLYIQKLYETELGETRAQNDAREALRRLTRLKEESQSDTSAARAELQRSVEQVAQLTVQLAQLEERARVLEHDKKELQLAASAGAGIAAVGIAEAAATPSSGVASRPEAAGFSAFDHLANGIVVTDLGGQIAYANPVAEQWLERSRDQLVGSEALSLWDSDAWRSAIHSLTDQWTESSGPASSASSDKVKLCTSLSLEHEGRAVQVDLTPLSLDGHHAGAIALLHGVPQTDERTRARDEFLASLAQELRTPMTSILGYTELLMNESVGKLGEIQRKFLQRVQANVERMSGMLNDLIGVTTIDSGKLVIELEPVDIVGVIETALRKVQFRLEEKELDTQVEIGDIPVVLADPECVQQIIDNLLTNACKSSQTGSVISIRANVQTDEPDKQYLRVAVSDTGGGIAPEDRGRVFERFYRADNALIAGLGETGVGLAIVKSLVEAHHGRVWTESEMGVGTTFNFVLPFGLEREMDSGSVEKATAGPGAAGSNGRG